MNSKQKNLKNKDMKPIKFKEHNVVFAENQPQYIPLPALRYDTPSGDVVCCHSLSFRERIRVLFTGKIWMSLMMFGQPLTPSYLTTIKNEVIKSEHTRLQWLGIINQWIVQWFFIRIFSSQTQDGIHKNYGILYWVWPLTGWGSSYKIIGRKIKYKHFK